MAEKNTEEEILKSEEQNTENTTGTASEASTVEQTTTDDAAEDETESTAAAEEEKSVEEQLALARAEIDDLKTQALYKQAEFDNYRKRVIKEKADLILNGSKSAVTAMLPVIDDLERALPSMKKAEDVAAVAEGVELIYQKFLKALAGLGVKPIETEGKEFNVDLHEAVAQVPGVADEQKGFVIDCVEKGYTLNDQVIRYAKVAVGM